MSVSSSFPSYIPIVQQRNVIGNAAYFADISTGGPGTNIINWNMGMAK